MLLDSNAVEDVHAMPTHGLLQHVRNGSKQVSHMQDVDSEPRHRVFVVMISFTNGPLQPFGAPVVSFGAHGTLALDDPRIKICAPDKNVPPLASGIGQVPRLCAGLHTITSRDYLVYLDAHRAQNDLIDIIQNIGCPAVLQGDSMAIRPHNRNIVAQRLEAKCPPVALRVRPHLHMSENIEQALSHRREGDTRVLVSDKANCEALMEHLRPGGVLEAGDPVYDFVRGVRACVKSAVPAGAARSTVVRLDNGKAVMLKDIWRRLVETPFTLSSGECDTLIIFPDVCEKIGQAACRRVRYQIVTIRSAPTIYANRQELT